jgi:hypothetical protein
VVLGSSLGIKVLGKINTCCVECKRNYYKKSSVLHCKKPNPYLYLSIEISENNKIVPIV